jgi:hypothetical protein
MQSSDQTIETAEHPPAAAVPVAEHDDHGDGDEHVHLPPPSIWPISLAGGIALAGFGLVTDFPISILGVCVMFIAIVFWIQELRHELH